MTQMIRSFLFTLTLTLSGCGGADDPGAAGMTVGENQRLEEAARRLEARTPSPARDSAQQLEAEVDAGIAAEAESASPAR